MGQHRNLLWLVVCLGVFAFTPALVVAQQSRESSVLSEFPDLTVLTYDDLIESESQL
jgi:hypothetical protein